MMSINAGCAECGEEGSSVSRRVSHVCKPSIATPNVSTNHLCRRLIMNTICCADCGVAEGDVVNLKTCKSCMLVKYCNADCQRNHWPKHKMACKLRAAELRDEALFKDPPAKEDCPICFLPMPEKLVCCVSLTRDYNFRTN